MLGAHFLLLTFFENFTFWTTFVSKKKFFLKNMILGAHFVIDIFRKLHFLKHFIFDNFYSTKNFLRGWLLVLGLKECLVECATLCVKSEYILIMSILDSTLLSSLVALASTKLRYLTVQEQSIVVARIFEHYSK